VSPSCAVGVTGWRLYRTVAGDTGSYLLVTTPSSGTAGYSCSSLTQSDLTPDGSLDTANAPNLVDNTSDGNSNLIIPKTTNFSAPLNARWVFTNTTGSSSGGCGVTGSALACYSSNLVPPTFNTTTDSSVRLAMDITSYNTGDYTIQYRVSYLGLTKDGADGTIINPTLGGLRVGSADNNVVLIMAAGSSASANINNVGCSSSSLVGWTSPLTTANEMYPIVGTRNSASANWALSGGSGGCNGASAISYPPFPFIDTVVWVKWVKKGTKLSAYMSSNGRDWTTVLNRMQGAGTPVTYWDTSANNPTQFEIDIMQSNAAGSGSTGTSRYYIEIDSFTLTVN
jgi:hypothetical protein